MEWATGLAPYELIRDAILDGTLAPGAPLVEASIAKQYGVSRTPIREALMRLEQDGLVERGQRGLIVRYRTPDEIIDIYDVRAVLEAEAARAAAARHTAVDDARLRRARTAFEQCDRSDSISLADTNRSFHQSVWFASHNKSLIDVLDRLNLHLLRYPATTLSFPGRWDEAIEEHAAIVDAILSGNQEAAEEATKKHFTTARDIRLKLWEEITA